jgi:serine/threonine-protein kinase
MATANEHKTTEPVTVDLLAVLRRSGIVPNKQWESIRAKVASGSYPQDAAALAGLLVRNSVLTEYQARCLLHGRAHGLSVGRYVILDLLGKGGMGRVYRARHKLMGRIVALKFISRQFLVRPGSVARFLREMRLVGRLDHPNIVRALDADQVGDLPYIVMEYVRGENLDELLRIRGPLPVDDVVRYAVQAALALAHAHDQGVVHRDVKPSNLLLGEDGRIRILDLGLGALMEMGEDDRGSFATGDGFAVGTIEFMSPEQAAGRSADGRSDLFSLGCTMYNLITGQIPFPGESKVECLARRIHGRPVPIELMKGDLPVDLIRVLDRLMANRPEDRFQTGVELANALQAISRRLATSSAQPIVHQAPVAAEAPPHSDDAPGPVSPDPTSGFDINAPLPPWFRFLSFLAELPAVYVVVSAAAILLLTFLLGFGLGSLRP